VSDVKAIVNGKLLIGDSWQDGFALLYNETIQNIVPQAQLPKEEFAEMIDAQGQYVAPGLIDIHVHGCNGADTMDRDDNALAIISKGLASTGVTSFLPTTMTMELPRIQETLARIRQSREYSGGAQILGCHLEGPFINKKYKGAQAEQHIKDPDFSLIQDYSDIIRIVTLAPELSGSQKFIEQCLARGIVLSLGHSNATYEQALQAFQWGVQHATHTFNAMPPLHHRLPGAVAAVLENEQVSCELIADNIHVHPGMQKIMLRLKTKDKMILITDAMRACLLGEGRYDLGGQMVNVRDGAATLDNGTIAGSTLRLNQAVRNFVQNTGLGLAQAWQMVSLNPAVLIGVQDRKGSIALGKDADVIIFDENLTIDSTLVLGKKVYGRER
jgi:N-acetylglucosamine-6-phosphate deacetylase